MTNKVEILAPAGSMDALTAAARCGANAVYLGAGDFNARRNAENFTEKELREAIEYCHIRGIKVYLTLNTLVSDAEIPSALELISCVCAMGVDALIIQDLGIVELVKQVAPDMPLHASTQMSVMNVAGFKKLEELGFKRAVLPRELTFEEIRDIAENTDMELEMFIHGALCMCVSGQCYLSGMLGGRSGNRGLCAQPCRLPFAAPGGTGYDLSLRDLSLMDHMDEIVDLGIASLKIEGRMKRPEYVAAAVTVCKNALAHVEREYYPTRDELMLEDNLKAVFSRSGFTDGYFENNRGISMFGTRRKEDVAAAAPVLRDLARLYEHEPQTINISMSLTAELGKPLMASASTGKVNTFVTSDYKVQKAINHATEVSKIREQLKKTGGTAFSVKMTDIKIDEDVNIPISEINNIRRMAIASLEHKLSAGYKKDTIFDKTGELIDDYSSTLLLSLGSHKPTWRKQDKTAPSYVARFSSADQIPDTLDARVTSIIVPLYTTEDKYSRLRSFGIPFGIELPRALYGSLRDVKSLLKDAKKRGASFAFCGTLDAVMLAKSMGFPVMGGPTLNIYNSLALDAWDKIGIHSVVVSSELELDSIKNLRGSLPRGILAYGRTPLMLTRNCPIKNGRNCKSCGSELYLTDRKGIRFPVTCRINGGLASEILNSRPIYLADRERELYLSDFLLLYFTVENKNEVDRVINNYLNGSPSNGDFTRGLYYRGVE